MEVGIGICRQEYSLKLVAIFKCQLEFIFINHYQKKLKERNERNDPAYHLWRKEIFKKFPKCILNSDECSGYRIAHHIYSWSDYPKLRYKVSNGVTLCQAHHPKTRAKEKLFKKLFSYLINQK